MTEFKVSGRSDLDAGESGNERSNAPMDVAMKMAMAATSITAETAGATILELMERNENGKQTRKSEAPAAPSDCRSLMERMTQQQALELTQLHRTVGHLANLVESLAAREEAQRLAIMTSMTESEQKLDARHEDDKLCGVGIPNRIAKNMNGLAHGQERREREGEMTARTDSGGLEDSQVAEKTQEEGPEERQQLQQQLRP